MPNGTTKTVYDTQLPKFKDKVMYFNGKRGETSYVVASSFRGILRLSPNDSSSVFEKHLGLLSPDEEITDKSGNVINYTDAVVGETDGSLGYADMQRRLIRVSDSDGLMIGIRFGDFTKENGCSSVEFENLNVLGMVKPELSIVLYSDADNYKKDSFILGNTSMPIKANTSRIGYKKYWRADVHDIHLNQNEDGSYGDDSCIIFGVNEDKRRFRYGIARDVVNSYVMEALLSLQTVPTGSIHFVPITIEQYFELEKKGTHNRTYKGDESTDPIIRDYLLCDGRSYSTRDFPQLAKVLWGEKIQYWREIGNSSSKSLVLCTTINGKEFDGNDGVYGSDHSTFVHKNKYAKDSIRLSDSVEIESGEDEIGVIRKKNKLSKYTFRVPDLRGMFIKSVPLKRNDSHVINNKSDYERGELTCSGTYMPDNIPYYRNLTDDPSKDIDEHFHFTHFGSYERNLKIQQYKNTEAKTVYAPAPVSTGNADNFDVNFISNYNKSLGSNITTYDIDKRWLSTLDSNRNFSLPMLNSLNILAWNYGYKGPFPGFCKCHFYYFGFETHPFYFYFTVKDKAFYDNKGKYIPNAGATSYNVSSYALGDSDTSGSIDVYYENDIRYRGAEKTFNPQEKSLITAPLNYKLENAPTHIICVPLIKI